MSYFSSHEEERRAHHPTKGMDGDSASCFISGYHTATWWRVTFNRVYHIKEVNVYGTVKSFTNVLANVVSYIHKMLMLMQRLLQQFYVLPTYNLGFLVADVHVYTVNEYVVLFPWLFYAEFQISVLRGITISK